jgi:hypothetical protein
MKTLKKAAVIGAVAYGAYQLGKLSGGFKNYGGWGNSHGDGFKVECVLIEKVIEFIEIIFYLIQGLEPSERN